MEDEYEDVTVPDLKGVGPKLAGQLQEAGFDDLNKVAETTVKELTQIPGLGKIKAQKMIDEAKALIEEFGVTEEEE